MVSLPNPVRFLSALFFASSVFPPTTNSNSATPAAAVIAPNARVDCTPRWGEGKRECLLRGCQWDENYDKYNPTVPLCYFPPRTGYGLAGHQPQAPNNLLLRRLSSGPRNPYGKDFEQLEFSTAEMGSAVHVRIGLAGRFTPPVSLNFDAQIGGADEKLLVRTSPSDQFDGKGNSSSTAREHEDPSFFSFTVQRESDGSMLWDTSIGALLFADQFVQIAAYLPGDRLYGFGENMHQQLKHDFSKYTSWGMFARDQAPDAYNPNPQNLYGVHPFYLGLEPSGKAHGVLIFNSNPQEITTGPSPHLVYRTLGGQLDLFFFPGPLPEMVVQQYQQLVGRPCLPAIWALGYQFSRFGYKGLEDMKATVGRIRSANIPLDVVFSDIDYMDHFKDFSVDQRNWSGLGDFVRSLHQIDLKFVPIVDPAIQVDYPVFERGRSANASFVEWERVDQVPEEVARLYPLVNGTKTMLGVVWPDRHVAFPDFLDPENSTERWWTEELKRFHDEVPFDGLWIDMNEPSNFGTNQQGVLKGLQPLKCPLAGPDSHFDAPPYPSINAFQWWPSGGSLSEKSLCMLARTGRGRLNMYDTHNLYGWAETVTTRKAMEAVTGHRGQLVARSTFPSSGRYGSHWTGDNSARWADLRASVIGVMEFNMFGIPHVGADVCGFNLASEEELCLRWQQLGAFHPFFRNHNSDDQPPQDPAHWRSVAVATRAANLFRYKLLPLLYSLHFRVSLLGGTVVRPLLFEFPADPNTHQLGTQFLWGRCLMVIPVLYTNVDIVRGYFPPQAIWYSISEAHKFATKMPSGGGYHELNAPRDTALPTFLRGGCIIPKQKAGQTVAETCQNPFQLMMALDPETQSAEGEMFWDDGQSIVADFDSHPYYRFDFKLKIEGVTAELVINCTHRPEKAFPIPLLSGIEIVGYPSAANHSTLLLTVDERPWDNNIAVNGREGGGARQQQLVKAKLNPRLGHLRIWSPKGLLDWSGEEENGRNGQQRRTQWTIEWSVE